MPITMQPPSRSSRCLFDAFLVAVLSDSSIGYQVLFGADYWLTESLALGFRGRWVNAGSFQSGEFAWNPLRSHPPNLRLDGSEPVSGQLTTDGIRTLGFTLDLRYQF